MLRKDRVDMNLTYFYDTWIEYQKKIIYNFTAVHILAIFNIQL